MKVLCTNFLSDFVKQYTFKCKDLVKKKKKKKLELNIKSQCFTALSCWFWLLSYCMSVYKQRGTFSLKLWGCKLLHTVTVSYLTKLADVIFKDIYEFPFRIVFSSFLMGQGLCVCVSLQYVEKLDLSGFVSLIDDCSRDRNLEAARMNLRMKDGEIKLTVSSNEVKYLMLIIVYCTSITGKWSICPNCS